MKSRHQLEVDEIRGAAADTERDLSERLQRCKEKKKALKTDKNQLLDFVEESVQKQQADEAEKTRLGAKLAEVEALLKHEWS